VLVTRFNFGVGKRVGPVRDEARTRGVRRALPAMRSSLGFESAAGRCREDGEVVSCYGCLVSVVDARATFHRATIELFA
jgi:hypothetical protein